MKPLVLLLVLSSSAFGQDSFSYIWNNYQIEPEIISELNVSEFDYGHRLNAWAVSAVVRANIITFNYKRALYIYENYFQNYKFDKVDTEIEILALGGLVSSKNRDYITAFHRYEEAIKLIDKEGNPDYLLGQLAIINFQMAKINQELANIMDVVYYFEQAATYGKLSGRDDILFDALINNSLHHIEYLHDIKKAEKLLAQALELPSGQPKQQILLYMSQARITAVKKGDYKNAIEILERGRDIASASGEYELFSTMARMIMDIESTQLYEREKRITLTLQGIVLFIIVGLSYAFYKYRKNPVFSELSYVHRMRGLN